jgi:RNA polymerase sigma factor (sigma-70 family)
MIASAKQLDTAESLSPGLIARAQSGDNAALEELIRHYQGRIAAKVISVVGDDADWQDLCQRIFVKMVLGLPRLKTSSVFEPWLLRIARNECFDHLRRRRARRLFVPWEHTHDNLAAEESPRADSASRLAVLDDAIAQLPAGQRELVTLMRTRKYSYQALAQLTGDSLGAIKSRLFRARQRLRHLIAQDESNREN